jgi:antitoxin (DNA-binding transcriptional repressor) of toxin-antitoxin stability system
MKHDSISLDEKAAALLRVASYLGRPQQFMAITDAGAEMRSTLELAAKGSVVLTTHGEPAAAVVPFATLEDMRRALLHLLVAEIETTFTHSKERLKSRSGEVPLSSEEEMEGLVGEALRGARQPHRRSGRKVPRE